MINKLLAIAASDSQVAAWIAASRANLDRKRAAGTYDTTLALRLFRNNAVDAAKAYNRNNGYFDRAAFNADTLDAVAGRLLQQWERGA
jgi:hypothetical protein